MLLSPSFRAARSETLLETYERTTRQRVGSLAHAKVTNKYTTRRPPPKSRRVAHRPELPLRGSLVLGPWLHGMSQAQYTIRLIFHPKEPQSVGEGSLYQRFISVYHSSDQRGGSGSVLFQVLGRGHAYFRESRQSEVLRINLLRCWVNRG